MRDPVAYAERVPGRGPYRVGDVGNEHFTVLPQVRLCRWIELAHLACGILLPTALPVTSTVPVPFSANCVKWYGALLECTVSGLACAMYSVRV